MENTALIQHNEKPQAASSLRKLPVRSTEIWKQQVSEQTGLSIAKLDLIQQGNENRLSAMDPMERRAKLIILMPLLAEEYGARVELPTNVLGECISLIVTKFHHLGLNEIREAYRQWAAGELDLGGEAEMYGGYFNVAQLGKVLRAYNLIRLVTLSQMIKRKSIEERKQQEEERAAQNKIWFEENFIKILEEAKTKITDWTEVPLFYYDACKSRNLFQLDREEALEIFAEAKKLAVTEIAKRKEDFLAERCLGKLSITPNYDLEDTAKIIARKITVYRKLIQSNQ